MSSITVKPFSMLFQAITFDFQTSDLFKFYYEASLVILVSSQFKLYIFDSNKLCVNVLNRIE